MLLIGLVLSHSRAETAIELDNQVSIGHTLFQNTHKGLKYGGPCRDRTCDHLIKSQMLYQLS